MNRKERRAALKRGGQSSNPVSNANLQSPLAVDQLIAQATGLFGHGQFAQADSICRGVLANHPKHVDAINLLGLTQQAIGHHDAAIKLFTQAISLDQENAACHYNIASSFQAKQLLAKARSHFMQSIVLGLSGQSIERLIKHNPVVAACLDRMSASWPVRLAADELLGKNGFSTLADDVFLQSALAAQVLADIALQEFLTQLRAILLRSAAAAGPDFGGLAEKEYRFFSAIAQQCFNVEYVFSLRDAESRLADELRAALQERLQRGRDLPARLIVAVACYFPLHALAHAEKLLAISRPELGNLLKQQVQEPLEEQRDRDSIDTLTTIDDGVSMQVRAQYEENPFPRWTVMPRADADLMIAGIADNGDGAGELDIFVAGCGTGRHPIQVAQIYPNGRILAVDVSLASLAYARRKTREAGLRNIAYAQADILKLGSFDRRFDRIEAAGVLHHLEDPIAGWRILLSLLRPGGTMVVGLYSALARRAVAACRAFIAKRDYGATPEDIRACRQDLIAMEDGCLEKNITGFGAFYTTSGCRDLLFNVMEHHFTIPQIQAFVLEYNLSFLGFDVDPRVRERFQARFSDPAAITDFNSWHEFETGNPQTFIDMYVFAVRKDH